jgi:hypothetical protein
MKKREFDPFPITVDFGTSLIKVIYHPPEAPSTAKGMSEKRLLLIPPTIQQVDECTLKPYRDKNTRAYPENNAWVSIYQRIDEPPKHYAVGLLAQSILYHVPDIYLLATSKRNNVLIYLPTILGAIATRHCLPQQFRIKPNLLIPYNEFTSRESLHVALEQTLSRFSFCDREYTVTIEGGAKGISTAFEGYGLLSNGREPNNKTALGKSLKDSTIAIVNIGYRDMSLLVLHKGNCEVNQVANLGMASLLQLLSERCSTSVSTHVAGILSRYHQVKRPKTETVEELAKFDCTRKRILKPLLQSEHNEIMANKELEDLIEAIEQCSMQYLRSIMSYIGRLVARYDIEEWILGGGTARFLGSHLSDGLINLDSQVDVCSLISWGNHLDKIAQKLFPHEWRREWPKSRLSDVLGFHLKATGEPLTNVIAAIEAQEKREGKVARSTTKATIKA